MNQTSSGRMPVKLGPLALLLTVISICLTTMAILTFATARADRRLAEKYAATVRLRYELDQEGQSWLRDVQAQTVSPDPDGTYETVLERDGSTLTIRVEDGAVVAWRHQRTWEEDLEWDLWPGL